MIHPEKHEGHERMIEDLRRRSPDEKLRAAAGARRISLELMRAGIRMREPDLDPAGVERRLRELIFPDDRR